MARRDAVLRSMSTKADKPSAPASLVTLRTWGAPCSCCMSLRTHWVTVAESTASIDRRYSVGPVSASMVRSCVGCRYKRTPATCCTRSRRRCMLASWSPRPGTMLMSIRPVCSMVLLAASTPITVLRLCTSGSARMARAAACCSSAIRSNDTSCAASMRACSWPVSCVGNRPFGITMYSSTVSTMVSTATTNVRPWWRSTHCSWPS